MMTIVIIVFLLLSAIGVFVPMYINKKKWKELKHFYITEARRINHDEHRQRMILWLQSLDAEEIFINQPKSFRAIYNDKVEKIGEEIIQELTKKYTDEYQSRNKKSTKAI